MPFTEDIILTLKEALREEENIGGVEIRTNYPCNPILAINVVQPFLGDENITVVQDLASQVIEENLTESKREDWNVPKEKLSYVKLIGKVYNWI